MQDAGCVEVGEDGAIDALTLGRTASFYYLKHESMRVLSQGLRAGMGVPEVGPALLQMLKYGCSPQGASLQL